MSRRNNGNFISATEQATDSNTANGIFTLTDAARKTALGSFPTGRFTPSRSLRFRASNSAYLSRTFGTPTDVKTQTLSLWIKRGLLGNGASEYYLLTTGTGGTECRLVFNTDDTFTVFLNNVTYRTTTQVFRDPSAWYHLVFVLDTANAIVNSRFLMYVNGVVVSSFSVNSAITQNATFSMFSAVAHNLCRRIATSADHLDGYLAEVNLVDGQALPPSSFGLTDPETGTWVPKPYSGTYGTNGFYLPFNDPTSTTTIGYDRQLGLTDSSKNNWTSSGISTTAGVTYDSMVDVPGIASVSNTADVGGVQRGNYATLSPVNWYSSGPGINYDGSLRWYCSGSPANQQTIAASIASNQKFYCEFYLSVRGAGSAFGIISSDHTLIAKGGVQGQYYATAWSFNPVNGSLYNNSASSAVWPAIPTATQMCLAVDPQNNKWWFGTIAAGVTTWYTSTGATGGNPVAGTGSVSTLTANKSYIPYCEVGVNGEEWIANFGQRPYAGTPPAGYNSLNTTNLPNPSIKRPTDHFDIKTWSGNGKALTVGNIAKQTTATQIPKSLRFRASATAYLSKTFSNAPTSANTQTRSLWIKRGAVSSDKSIWTEYNSGNGKAALLSFAAAGHINAQISNGGTGYSFKTINRYQDPSAWYHIVWVIDSTAAVNNNRMKVYVNGVLQAIENQTYVAQNTDIGLTASGTPIGIGIYDDFSSYPLDGYLAEFYNIDGQALTPSSFGQFDSNNNWFPKAYTGTYGNHGFYLPFNDPTSTTTIGYDRQLGLTDSSKNNWTSSGISVATATIADRSIYDSMYDSPTDGVDSSGNTIGSFATFDPRETGSIYTQTLSQGNLTLYTVNDGYGSTLAMYTGKWYWEFVIDARVGGGSGTFGIMDATIVNTVAGDSISNMYGSVGGAPSVGYNNSDGHKYIKTLTAGGVDSAYGTSYTTGDIIGNALDLDAKTITFYKNGVSQGAISLPPNNNGWRARMQVGGGTSLTYSINFGQRPFSYTPPTGHLSLNTKNLRDVGSYNLPDTYGNFVNNPDFVWIKNRNSTESHETFDSLRGPSNYLPIGANGAAYVETVDANTLTEFSPNGFKLGSGSSLVNTAANTYVAWCWNAGSSTVTNNDGTLSSTVRANPTAGFSIVSNYGTGANATVGHGLGAAPAMILRKARNLAYSWIVYHQNSSATPGTKGMYLDYYGSISTTATFYNSTPPNSSVFSLGSSVETNYSGYTYMAYCWTPIPGYSAFGSYIGNGSADGPFIHCGFRPKYLLMKNVTTFTAGYNWFIYDTARDTYNPAIRELEADLAVTEDQYGSSTTGFDILSNGFKLRTGGVSFNESGSTHIYAAFAETPFKYANAR